MAVGELIDRILASTPFLLLTQQRRQLTSLMSAGQVDGKFPPEATTE